MTMLHIAYEFLKEIIDCAPDSAFSPVVVEHPSLTNDADNIRSHPFTIADKSAAILRIAAML